MAEGAHQPIKICPDCAEEVLAGARKCRFCGYRFDGADTAPLEEGSLLGMIVRPKPRPITVPAMVARWGVELADEENALAFIGCKVEGSTGYALVTDLRLVVFAVSGHKTAAVVDRPLEGIEGVESSRHGLVRRLQVSWYDRAVTLDGLGRSELARLQSLLEDAADSR